MDQEKQVQEDYDRFVRATPSQLTDAEQAHIPALPSDIPALWNAPTTTNADRKKILRYLVKRMVVQVRCDNEFVRVTIHCVGGYESRLLKPRGLIGNERLHK